jgi:hypothetical protein
MTSSRGTSRQVAQTNADAIERRAPTFLLGAECYGCAPLIT